MSFKERQRLKVLERVVRSETTLVEASRQLGLSYRQTIRIRDRYVSEGDAGLVHRLRGRPSGRALDEGLKSRAVSLYAKRYKDFGPTLASEMLSEREGIVVHPETLRLWLVEAEKWEVRKARVRPRKQREPRKCFGELVQMDGSFHDWFEGRAPKCFLMSMVDDATGRTLLSFAPQETTWAAPLRRRLRRTAMRPNRESLPARCSRAGWQGLLALSAYGTTFADVRLCDSCRGEGQFACLGQARAAWLSLVVTCFLGERVC